MKNTIKDITSYIDFLRKQGFLVTLSCFDSVLERHLPVLLKYEVHQCAVCSYLKANEKTKGKCPKNKAILNKNYPKTLTYSCCYAGVEEYVYPVICDNSLICCVHISGFRGVLEKSSINYNKYYSLLGRDFFELYQQLSVNPPKKEEITEFVKPLEYMLISLKDEELNYNFEGTSSSKIYRKVLKYIYDNYMNNIDVNDIAKSLNYSASYIRNVFSKHSNKTVSQTINDIKLSQAKNLLKSTTLSITRIALESGFCDGNYFSYVFKKKYGISPKKYRKDNAI